MAKPRAPAFTPAEAAVLDVYRKLGDAARRGLHVSERTTARLVGMAHAAAERVRRAASERFK